MCIVALIYAILGSSMSTYSSCQQSTTLLSLTPKHKVKIKLKYGAVQKQFQFKLLLKSRQAIDILFRLKENNENSLG